MIDNIIKFVQGTKPPGKMSGRGKRLLFWSLIVSGLLFIFFYISYQNSNESEPDTDTE